MWPVSICYWLFAVQRSLLKDIDLSKGGYATFTTIAQRMYDSSKWRTHGSMSVVVASPLDLYPLVLCATPLFFHKLINFMPALLNWVVCVNTISFGMLYIESLLLTFKSKYFKWRKKIIVKKIVAISKKKITSICLQRVANAIMILCQILTFSANRR